MDNRENDRYYSSIRPEMLRYIPPNAKKILDVGCADGSFSSSIKRKFGADVWGVEINAEVAEMAKKNVDKILIGDILKVIDDIPDTYFDCIVFNDVLEHMVNPYTVLSKIKTKLTSTGVVVCSIPNIRHIKALKKLLMQGKWKYENFGTFDKTHLRFFTKKSIIDMFKDLNYQIIKIEGINATKWWKFLPISILTLGLMSDTRYLQFACVVKPK